ncbi:hypothetical protein RM530_13945 [Algiphilus sp. W345]|uniref:DesT tetracyclin repressor-like C-terminal domain-containing protein n=1 Tax=Banduia mediterranea TaxID=3075609 RepID=A0ABU2WMA2_9GAMM|nr:hypothetical protein [Algiphilus sp. W345]MDT0498451.1 hypothetical protein [Algiphilus sp. W345]
MQRSRLGAQYLLGYIARHRDSWPVRFAEGVAGTAFAARVTRYRERIVDMIAMTLSGLAPGRREVEARPYALALIGAGEAITNWWVNQNEVSLNAMSTSVSDIVEAVSKAYVAGAAPVAERRTRRARQGQIAPSHRYGFGLGRKEKQCSCEISGLAPEDWRYCSRLRRPHPRCVSIWTMATESKAY